MNVFHDFHTRGLFEKSFDATFVTLIPKKPEAVDIKDIQPISLEGEIYKIAAKEQVENGSGEDHFQASKCFHRG